jgi:hypothetical protein
MVMSLEWIVTGMILLGAMVAGGISLWIKRRRESQNPDLYGSRIRPEFDEEEK